MLVTESAAALIRNLVEDSDLPGRAGLRIARRNDLDALAMELTPEPRDEDTVLVVAEESAVFLDPSAATRVRGQTLDAEIREEFRSFYLRD